MTTDADVERAWAKLLNWNASDRKGSKAWIYKDFPGNLACFRFLESYMTDRQEVEDVDNLIGHQTAYKVFCLVRDSLAKAADEEFLLACLQSKKIFLALACAIGMSRGPKPRSYSEVILKQLVGNAATRLEYFCDVGSIGIPHNTKSAYISVLSKYGGNEHVPLLQRLYNLEFGDLKFPERGGLYKRINSAIASIQKRSK